MRRRVFGAAVVAGAMMLATAGLAHAGDDVPVAEGSGEERTAQAQAAPAPPKKLLPRNSNYLLPKIRAKQQETWRWQRLMGKPLTRSVNSAATSRKPEYRRWVLNLWTKRAARERRLAHDPPRRAQWLCIYRHERHPRQGWSTRTGNGYYGGLQMDISFQRTYGGWLLRQKGTANNWTSLEQIWVAERAYRSGRGFHPWPNTARYCGLI